ncbi:hypothetical protein QBC33DRAFT_140279 [Phialemonium atrogriseum]|uniref:Only prolin and serin are matching in the corresponding protein n=1 Tax=Phialemonium atrogriseum TaxID=1093897 RepID=A0AAJ0FFE9_9PEZI|nr:uncharacterized protein QBC33DRAFT_140279 [Phialemonium atrogriseum]KAK1765387.1 hypothetical protein QBC33DRAFT_140279 [Phialemonium atrogriseum]
MSPGLKPLILPQLVEQRKLGNDMADGDQTYSYYTNHSSSSSSDLASPSPITPTFTRNGYSRYSASTSSLEQVASSCHDNTTSPAQLSHTSKGSKSQLPDVQEDPLREDEDITVLASHYELYGCLCDEPCVHRSADSVQTTVQYLGTDIDYDIGFLSDGDLDATSPRSKRRRNGSESTFTGWSRQLGSRFPTLTRWKSVGRRNDLTFSPASEPSLDHRPSVSRTVSRAASSSSSSISMLGRRMPDFSREFPPTPALSVYGSTDSIVLSSVFDVENASVRKDIERDRAMAATPLLPPLLTDQLPASTCSSLQASPLQSPTVAPSVPSPILEAPSPNPNLTPPLSNKPSVSSFRPVPTMTFAAATSPTGETASPIPNLIEHDKWSDCLGHANFTILPRPHQPAATNLQALSLLRADWDLARINYTKHLVRTGEHYGTTSNTYALTQAKWTEIEGEWHSIEDDLIERIVQNGNDEALAALMRRTQEDGLPTDIPRILDAEGKFPERGDVDIVGPMQRDAVMLRCAPDDKKNVSAWLKNLAEKVGLRK